MSALGRALDRALGRLDRNLRGLYGGAQVDRRSAGTQAARSADRLTGVEGEYEVHRDSAGHTYLRPKRPPRA